MVFNHSFIAVCLAAAVYLPLLLLRCFLPPLSFLYQPKEPSLPTHPFSIAILVVFTILFISSPPSLDIGLQHLKLRLLYSIHNNMDMALATPLLLLFSLLVTVSANFYNDFDITWGNDRAQILDNGNQLQLTLDRTSGCGFQSKQEYLYAKIDMQIKLVPGNSAGTVTAYYLSSQGPKHDEIDFEFLGNLSGDPYIMHTNVFAQGLGNREQQFYLWFELRPNPGFPHLFCALDANPDYVCVLTTLCIHSSNTIECNAISQANINACLLFRFSVDGTPVRVFKNREKELGGVDTNYHYPKNQAMRIYSSLWNAEDWATRGGLVKTDWAKAPFAASFSNFNAATSSISATEEALDSSQEQRLQWVQKNYMIYDYCADTKRFPQGLPPECK